MAASGGKEMEIAIKIAGKVESSFKNALSSAVKGLGNITKAVGAATAAAAAAVGAMGVAAINTGREFEGAMSQVAATMLIDKTTAEGQTAFETLENAARECGASTAFSATEAAEALNYLALAGYDADKAATALPTVLKLAGAGAMDLAAASDMVTDSMSALGIEATEANLVQFSDQLAQTASKANTSVSQLGEAILTVGGTAKGLAGGTIELNAALGILADNGLKGSEGGTHLRNIILSLQNPTDKAAASLKSLGVDVYDAQGNMRGLNDVFKDLQGAMAGMDNASKDSILSTLFNKTDLTAANAMLANCTDRFDELSASIENSAGACENMYAIQLDNLNGDIDILKSGLSDLGISIYQDLNGPLREMTQLATSMVGELSEAYKSGGMEGMVGAVGGCMAEVVNTIADYAPQVVSMGVDLLENFISGITDNSGALATAASKVITVFVEGLFTLVPQVILAGIDILTQFVQSMTAQLPQLISTGMQAIINFVNGIIQRLPEVISTALTLVQTLVNSIEQNAPMLILAAVQLIGSLVTGMAQMLPQLLQMGIQLIISLLQGIIRNLPAIIQAAVQIVMALISGLISAVPQLVAAIPQLIVAILDAIFSTDWLQVGSDIISGIADGFMSGFMSLVDNVKGLWSDFTGWLLGDDAEEAASGVAATSMIASGFSAANYTEATRVGMAEAEAYTAGLTDGLSGFTVDTSTVGLDSKALTLNLSTSGTESGMAFTASLNDSVSAYTLDTTGLATAGMSGTEALSTGITSNAAIVTIAANNLATDVNAAFDVGWSSTQSSAESAMSTLVNIIQTKAQAAVQGVKSAFENMTITIPEPRIPIINVSTSSVSYGDGRSVSVPNFSVSWNALGGIFDQPTIFNTPAGMQGVGEAGPEAVLPLDMLWAKMKEILNGAIATSGGTSLIDTFIEKLKGIGSGGGGQPELAGVGGSTIQYSPVYNLYGSVGKEEIAEADRMSQAEFNKLMKQYEKEQQRRKL